MRPYATALLALSYFCAASVVSAQPSVDVRGFRASTDANSGLYLEPASSPDTGDWNTSLWLSYIYRPITLRDATTGEIQFDVISHQLSADFTASVGIAKRLALGLDFPVLIYQTGDQPNASSMQLLGDVTLPSQSLGDLGLVGKLTIVRPTSGDLGGFALALHERFTMPTGDDGSFFAEGDVTSETRLLAEYRLVAVGAYLALGAKLRGNEARVACQNMTILPNAEDPCPTRFGHQIPFGFGLSVRPQAFGLDEEGRLTFFAETHGYLPLSPSAPFSNKSVSAAQLGLGVRVSAGNVSFLGGVETSLVGGVGNSPLHLLASVSWAPRFHDIDGDGVEDQYDQCLELPEDRDNFEDDDGCPEADNDSDGVLDEDDKCPALLEDEDGFEDEDGCPDPDNDADRVEDAQDACPDEPGLPGTNPQINGCPVQDTDADGIDNDKDKCPDQPEDKDGFEDEDGCPEPDNDGDGIQDAEDACPNAKGIDSGDPKEKGCPDPDPDKDSFMGAEDKCPDQSEVFNGLEDTDGCPDDDPKKKLNPLVTVKEVNTGPTIQMGGQLKFTDSGEVDPASIPLLRALAAEVMKHPEWTVVVGVRSSPKRGGEETANRHAASVVKELQRLSNRKIIGQVASWNDVKDASFAQVHGIGFKIRLPTSKPVAQ